MRSKIIQPRALFRIAGSSGSGSGASSAGTSAAAAAASASAGARTSAPSTLAARSSANAASSLRHHHQSPCIRASISSLARTKGSAGENANARSSAKSGGGASGNGRSAASRGGVSTSPSSRSAQQQQQQSSPVIPVHPPPHSSRSVALQSFFSQGRPLLEHNNLEANSRLSAAMGNAASAATSGGRQTGAIAMVVDMQPNSTASPQDQQHAYTDAELEQATEHVAGTLRQFATPQERADHIMKMGDEVSTDVIDSLPQDLQAKIRQKAEALMESMTDISEQLWHLDLSQESTSSPPTSPPIVSLQYHLPPLESLTKGLFNKIMDNATRLDRVDPISMHTLVSTSQAFEKSRQQLIKEALAHAEDPTLASALGPECELVVLGEPQGPRAEWGRGVTSYLARFGTPYMPPSAPRGGSEASRTKRLEDLTVFEVIETNEDASSGSGSEHRSLQEADEEDAFPHIDEARMAEALSPASSPPTMTHSGEDVNLWLGHAMVQEKMKATLEWDRIASLMDVGERRSPASSSIMDLTKLNATLPGLTMEEALRKQQQHKDSGDAAVSTPVSMDSVKRKRKKKMRKMKYKKLRKRQRAERLRMKK